MSFRTRRLRCPQQRKATMQRSSSKALLSARPLLTPKWQPVCRPIRSLATTTPTRPSDLVPNCSIRRARWDHASTLRELRCVGVAKSLHSSSEVRQEAAFEGALDQQEEKQARTPWHREGSDTPPVARERSAEAITKGVCNLYWCPLHLLISY